MRTSRAHDVVSWCALGCIMAHKRPCHAPLWSCHRSPLPCRCAHACTGASCSSEAAFCPRSRYKIVSRPNPCRARTKPYRRPCHSTLLPCRSVVSQPCCAILRLNCCPLATIQCFCIATPPGEALRTHTLPPASHACQPYHGPLMALSWRGLSRVVAESLPYRGCAPMIAVSRYNSIVS